MSDESVATIVIAMSGSPYVLATELYVTRNVTIIGESSEGDELVTLDARASAMSPRRILRIASNASVEVRNLTLTGAWTLRGWDPGGGAVSNEGTLLMTDCIITHNHAFTGGAVFSSGVLTLLRCTFTDNSAQFTGGAVTIFLGSVQIGGCVFQNNRAMAAGALNTFAPTNISNSIFRRNRARAEAGAIYASASQVIITNSEIVENDSGGVGGGVMTAGVQTRINIIDCLVADNSAKKQGGGLLNTKGGSNLTSTVHAFNVTFRKNIANQGSGVYNMGSLILELQAQVCTILETPYSQVRDCRPTLRRCALAPRITMEVLWFIACQLHLATT